MPPLILHFFPTFSMGGQQRRLAELIDGMDGEYRHRIVSLTPDLSGRGLVASSPDVTIEAESFCKSGFIHPDNVGRCVRIIRDLEPSVVCTYNWGAIEAVAALRFVNRRTHGFYHLHFEDGFGPDEQTRSLNRKRSLARSVLLRSAVTIVPSHVLEKIGRQTWRLPAARIRRVPNGIDLARFASPERNYDRTPITVGTVGAFRKEKNLFRLIRGVAAMTGPARRAILVGDGDELERLKAEASLYTDKTDIVFPGATPTPESAYREFDIFALSSDTEQMPISLMEAMASGLPVVATDVGDIRRMVSADNQRWIVPVDDDEAFAGALSVLANDPVLREKIGTANRDKAYNEFGREQMITTYRALFSGNPSSNVATQRRADREARQVG